MKKAKTLRIGLTGGIGSGKTICAAIFEELGIPVYYSDLRAKTIMNTDKELSAKILSAFGPQSYLSDGTLNRGYLSQLIFQDNGKIAEINAIVHPAVRKDFIDWCEDHEGQDYVLQESALLFETGSYKSFDKTILVDASEDERIRRVMKRDNITADNVRERMSKQLPSAKKRDLADIIIENEGGQGLMKQIIKIHLDLLSSMSS